MSTGPLSGVRVIDAANMIAGPSAAAMMADAGAEVIKIEPPQGDLLRGMIAVPSGPDPWWHLDNRGKRDIAVDLTTDAGVAVVHRLCETADVFLTNLTSERQERYQLTSEHLLDRYPSLIHATITGYGTDGPEADRLAFDHTAFFARGGVQRIMGDPTEGMPAGRAGQGDHTTALALLSSILLALRDRDRTGVGQAVEVALMQVAVWTLASDLSVGLSTGEVPEPRARIEWPSPLVCRFRCADERWISFCMPGDRHWPAFCEMAGHPEWIDDERFATADGRLEHAPELITACDEVFATADLATWGERSDAAGLTWGPIQSLPEIIDDPQAAALEAFPVVDDVEPGYRNVAAPLRLSGSEMRIRGRGPNHGEHTTEILREAGYDEDAIAELLATGVVFDHTPDSPGGTL